MINMSDISFQYDTRQQEHTHKDVQVPKGVDSSEVRHWNYQGEDERQEEHDPPFL